MYELRFFVDCEVKCKFEIEATLYPIVFQFIICDKNDRKVVAELVERPSPVSAESSRFPEAPGQSTASRSDFDIPVHLHVEKTAASTSGQAAGFSAGSHSGQTQSRQGDPQPEYADIPSGGAYIPSGYAGNPFKEGDGSSPQKDAGIRSKDPDIPLEDADNTSSSSHADTTSELSADTSGKLSIKEAVDDIQTKELQVLLTSMQSNS